MTAERAIQAINLVHAMCIESCEPDIFDAWERVKDELYENRNSLKHYFVNGEEKDTCALCGLDLRNMVHRRA